MIGIPSTNFFAHPANTISGTYSYMEYVKGVPKNCNGEADVLESCNFFAKALSLSD